MTSPFRLERLEGRDTPAVFTGAGFPADFQPIPGWTGEVQDAWGDFLGTGGTQVAFTPGAGGGPVVRVYELSTGHGTAGRGWVEDVFLFDPNFRGGVDLTTAVQPGGPDLLVAGAGNGGGPVVRVVALDGSVDRAFYAYDPSFRGGVSVDVSDTNGDGRMDVTTLAGPGGGPLLRQFDLYGGLEQQFYIGPAADQSGAYGLAPGGLAEKAFGAVGPASPYVVVGPNGTHMYDPTTGAEVLVP